MPRHGTPVVSASGMSKKEYTGETFMEADSEVTEDREGNKSSECKDRKWPVSGSVCTPDSIN